MKESKPTYVHFKRVRVIFGPDEKNAFLDKYENWHMLWIKPRTKLKPWGTREAFMQIEVSSLTPGTK